MLTRQGSAELEEDPLEPPTVTGRIQYETGKQQESMEVLPSSLHV